MTIRKIKLPDDLDLVIELLIDTFEYPDNPEWHTGSDEIEGYRDLIKAAKKFWPILSILRRFSTYLQNVFTGLIWEEDGKDVGIIALQQLPNKTDWFGRSLGIQPAYRRRGIGLKLFHGVLDMVEEEGGKRAYLLVIEGNTPARNLYKKEGMIDYASEVVLEHPGLPTPHNAQPTPSCIIQKRSIHNWQGAYQHACDTMPTNVKDYETIQHLEFKIPLYRKLFNPLFERAQGIEVQNFTYHAPESDQILGQTTLELRIKEGGVVHASATSTTGNPEIATAMVQHILSTSAIHSPNQRIRMDLPGWKNELIEAALAAGFEQKLKYRKMVHLFD